MVTIQVLQNEQPAYNRNGTYGDFVYTDETIGIIEKAASRKGSSPFFMYTALQVALLFCSFFLKKK